MPVDSKVKALESPSTFSCKICQDNLLPPYTHRDWLVFSVDWSSFMSEIIPTCKSKQLTHGTSPYKKSVLVLQCNTSHNDQFLCDALTFSFKYWNQFDIAWKVARAKWISLRLDSLIKMCSTHKEGNVHNIETIFRGKAPCECRPGQPNARHNPLVIIYTLYI